MEIDGSSFFGDERRKRATAFCEKESGSSCRRALPHSFSLLVMQQETRKTTFSSSDLLLSRRHEGGSAPSFGIA
ncbi:hypothetical protein MRB53_008078 [Persea americana]|uniref:Uncharacterized protein n=1 Tax=Persea americana TaxID=3435 RepID=A0ACC2MKT3_PERAE|nr:hypothetical protein MRB53_008078 [Persea americana]